MKQDITISVDVPCRFKGGCVAVATRRSGGTPLCDRHYRFRQMRGLAGHRRLAVPTCEQLQELLDRLDGMACPHCKRAMNWIATDGQATVITLQHYRSGELGFLCRSCNTRHVNFAGDSFLDTSPHEKHCARCDRMLPLISFHANRSRGRWMGVANACKECMRLYGKEYRERNREKYNAQRRVYEQRKRDEVSSKIVSVALEPLPAGEGE